MNPKHDPTPETLQQTADELPRILKSRPGYEDDRLAKKYLESWVWPRKKNRAAKLNVREVWRIIKLFGKLTETDPRELSTEMARRYREMEKSDERD